MGVLSLISVVLGYHSVFTQSQFFLPFIPTPFWIYRLFPLLRASNSKPSFCCQPPFGLLCLQYYPFFVHTLHFSAWILVHDPEQEVLGLFFSCCPGNTNRLLRVPEQRRTGKNCGTQHNKYGQRSYPVALPSLSATRRRPTPQKNSFDSSFISLLSLKLH